jgi:transposase
MDRMSNKMKKKAHSAEFKIKVAIAAIRGDKTTAELCQDYGVVSSQIFKWEKALLDHGQDLFKNGTPTQSYEAGQIERLQATIGKLKVENDFLSKFAGRNL